MSNRIAAYALIACGGVLIAYHALIAVILYSALLGSWHVTLSLVFAVMVIALGVFALSVEGRA